MTTVSTSIFSAARRQDGDTGCLPHCPSSPKHTETVWSGKPDLNSPDYGFGFAAHAWKGQRIVGHNGGFPGISAVLGMYIDSGYTVAVMANYDHVAETVNQKLRELITAGE